MEIQAAGTCRGTHMMSSQSDHRRWLRIGAIFTFATILASCTPVTYGTGTSTTLQTVRDFTGIFVIGDPTRERIDYAAPRPTTLATPPTNELPPPVSEPPANQAAAAPADPCQWWQYGWTQLSEGAQQALARLGWSEASWQSTEPAAWPASASSTWDGLRGREQRAAESLGYTQVIWDTCGLP